MPEFVSESFRPLICPEGVCNQHSATDVLVSRRRNTLAEFSAEVVPVAVTQADLERCPHLSDEYKPQLAHAWSWASPALLIDVCLVTAIETAARYYRLPTFKRPINLNDPDLQNPHAPNIVSYRMLCFISIALPIIVAAAIYGIIMLLIVLRNRSVGGQTIGPDRRQYRRTLPWTTIVSFFARDFLMFCLGLVLAHGINDVVTECIKSWVGRFRPDFVARCVSLDPNGECTGNPAKVSSGRHSFPSGHASQSFTGMVYLSLFLLRIWGRVFDVDHGTDFSCIGPAARAWRILISIPPVLVATYVAVTRVQQAVHHPTDIIVGATLGTIIAFSIHKYYYNARFLNPRRKN